MLSSTSAGARRSQEYNITNGFNNVPQGLLDSICDRVYIEFLKMDSRGLTVQQANRAKNHAVIKVEFNRRYQDAVGIRIDMRPDFRSMPQPSSSGTHSYLPGDLFLKTADFLGPSTSSVRTIKLQYDRGRNLSLFALLESFMRPGVHLFHFVCLEGRYLGCRDFVTQALYHMSNVGYVSPEIIDSRPIAPALNVEHAFDALGMRFTVNPPGQGYATSIDRGRFEIYRRVEAGYMPYDGSPAAANLANRLP